MKKEDVEFMLAHGGAFASSIAKAWFVADEQNRKALEEAFEELFNTYVGLGVN